jgi:2-keto-4-pentenoate hydratase/2-oxohepta-3-ene-1,7-dioic acid hydratase in catechol pathway
MPRNTSLKIARVRADGRTSTALIRGRRVHLVKGGPLGSLQETGDVYPMSQVQLLAPIQPGKIVAIGLNYYTHIGDRTVPSKPEPFLKAPNSLIGPEASIVLPQGAGRVDEEGEVVAVISRRAKNLSEDEVDDYILGYTCGNDVSAREWQAGDLQWWRAKSSDTFTAMGPWITTGLDPEAIDISVRLNGKEVQKASTAEMIYSVRQCIAFITSAMTLEPGDVVYTGTPGATSQLSAGDRIEVELGGIGVLSNPVAAG